MRSGTRRSAGRLSRANDQWPAAVAKVSISGGMRNFLGAPFLAKCKISLRAGGACSCSSRGGTGGVIGSI